MLESAMTATGLILTIEIMFYLLVMLLFLVTAFLNLQDMHSIRQEKWTHQDTMALIFRTLFYAFFLNLLIIGGTDIAILLYTISPWSRLTLDQVLGLVTAPILFSSVTFLLAGVVYGLAKAKDWYDLIDAEY